MKSLAGPHLPHFYVNKKRDNKNSDYISVRGADEMRGGGKVIFFVARPRRDSPRRELRGGGVVARDWALGFPGGVPGREGEEG